MRILIECFGPISKFEYDLDKDFIVIYGNNNIGKSYAMQIVYLLLKVFARYMNMRQYNIMITYAHQRTAKGIMMPRDKVEDLVNQFRASEDDSREITQDIMGEVDHLLTGTLMQDFLDSCKNTFGIFEKNLEREPKITIQYGEYQLFIDMKAGKITGKADVRPVYLKKMVSAFHKSRNGKGHKDIYVADNTDAPIRLIYEEIQAIFTTLIQPVAAGIENVYFLPASRSGIYAGMNAFGSIVAELSKNRAYFTKKIEFPGISEPISDYFISLSNPRNKINGKFENVYSDIENSILKGTVSFDRSKNAIMYKPENMDVAFEMSEVSSMVSEVAPVVAFLKYIISAGDRNGKAAKAVVFIEEPEAHLHPGNQIALIDIFARLIGENVKLILSSHSNYVFNKLNNLVLSKKLDYNAYEPIILQETADGSISKYILVDDLGAEDENFVDVSEYLYNEREEMIEKINSEGTTDDTENKSL